MGMARTKVTEGKTTKGYTPSKEFARAFLPKPMVVGKKKYHRYRPGTVALREIRKFQKSTGLLLSKKPFSKIVRVISEDYKRDMRFQINTMIAIQESTEFHLFTVFE